MMGIRLVELHKVLKPTGSVFLHCDPTASHYLKILNICTAPKDLPTGVFTTLDDQQMPSVDDYLIDPEYPV